MPWQWGNLGPYSSSLNAGACSGHIHVYLGRGPEGTTALGNTLLPPERRSSCRNREAVVEDAAEQWGEQNCKVRQEQQPTCCTGQMHPRVGGIYGKPGCSFCWLQKSFEVLFGKSSSKSRYSFLPTPFPFCVLIIAKSFLQSYLCLQRNTFFVLLYCINKWNCSSDKDGWCQGNASCFWLWSSVSLFFR